MIKSETCKLCVCARSIDLLEALTHHFDGIFDDMSRIANSNPAARASDSGNPLASSEKQFLQQVARQRVTTYDGNTWEYFDCGKPSAAAAATRERTSSGDDISPSTPLVCLPGTSGSARCFHLQMLALAAKGCRVIAVRDHR